MAIFINTIVYMINPFDYLSTINYTNGVKVILYGISEEFRDNKIINMIVYLILGILGQSIYLFYENRER